VAAVARWSAQEKSADAAETREVGRVLSGCQRVSVCLVRVGVSWGEGKGGIVSAACSP